MSFPCVKRIARYRTSPGELGRKGSAALTFLPAFPALLRDRQWPVRYRQVFAYGSARLGAGCREVPGPLPRGRQHIDGKLRIAPRLAPALTRS
jgi:hypothetical protein